MAVTSITVVYLYVFMIIGVDMLSASSIGTEVGSAREGSIKALENSIEDVISISEKLERLKNQTGICNDNRRHTVIVAFTAIMTVAHTLGAGEKVPYNNVVSNVGGGYDVQNRVFTAPISGIYTISVAMMANPSNSVHLKLVKDGNEIVRLWCQKDRHELSSQSVNLPLHKGSQIWVQQRTGSVLWHTEPYNVFSAALISEGHF